MIVNNEQVGVGGSRFDIQTGRATKLNQRKRRELKTAQI
jgi:hypothetical protein